MLIFNSPNNPTGTVFSNATLESIAELASKARFAGSLPTKSMHAFYFQATTNRSGRYPV